ncbi:MAG TPA: aldehyde dehydrogenase family protein, partial [Puia sp.]|nr:aldehyde dehydrogenase family protein [Puia sp.]
MSNPVFKSFYPFTQELFAEYPLMSDAILDAAIENASEAYRTWKKYKFSERADIFKNVAAILRRDQETLATLVTR